MKRFKLLPLLTSLLFLFSACDADTDDISIEKVVTSEIVTTATEAVSTPEITTKTETTSSNVQVEVELIGFDYNSIPEYSGSPYFVVNENVPYFEINTTDSFEIYSDLDNLGRCGVAFANVCKEIMPTDERGEIGSVKPTGWHSVKYDWVDGKYLFNRCHLIGFQLAGENANTKNLITGTRYMNMQGMLPFENMVDDYVDETNNHVLYRVTPIFIDNELLARGVLMEAYSVEDNGDGIEFNVFCYNIEPDVGIDYATGESWSTKPEEVIDEQQPQPEAVDPQPEAPVEAPQEQNHSMSYILNSNTKKFHYPSCSSVNQMKEENKIYFEGSRDDAINQGYDPCKRCNP